MPLLWLLVACSNTFAAGIVHIDSTDRQSHIRQQIEIAARFYGLEIENTFVNAQNSAAAVKAIRVGKPLAIVITADALPALNREQFFAAIQSLDRSTRVLITGITEQADPVLVRQWSDAAITGSKKVSFKGESASYAVADVKSAVRQLSGCKLPLYQNEVFYLTLDSAQGAQWLIAANSAKVLYPVLAKAAVGDHEVFFATRAEGGQVPITSAPDREPAIFASLAAPMIFLRYAAGERIWRFPANYGNLTIDDPWLREPYGHLSYRGLHREMVRHNFHTTLAFVPWNYARSQRATTFLFRDHPDRFSVCLHGNDHDGREFGPYDSKSFERQVWDIKQGLARMAKFSELTQLPYDPVMVFPHAIAPEKTLALLKRYNFLATVNSLNMPLDRTAPPEVEFVLRAVTLAFSNFASVRRYSAEAPIPESQLAIDAFLGNPMLFYVHQDFFASGINAFNKTADYVNQLEPSTRWRSLGHIAQHLYMERLREDGNYDIRAYTGTIRLENAHRRDVTFFVEKEENFAYPITVLVDGLPYPYERAGTRLRLQLLVRDGMSRQIAVRYSNDLDVAAIDISNTSLHIKAIRYLSDFRDVVVSKTALGRRFIRSYSERRRDWNSAVGALAALLVIVTIIFGYVQVFRKRRVAAQEHSSHGCGPAARKYLPF